MLVISFYFFFVKRAEFLTDCCSCDSQFLPSGLWMAHCCVLKSCRTTRKLIGWSLSVWTPRLGLKHYRDTHPHLRYYTPWMRDQTIQTVLSSQHVLSDQRLQRFPLQIALLNVHLLYYLCTVCVLHYFTVISCE